MYESKGRGTAMWKAVTIAAIVCFTSAAFAQSLSLSMTAPGSVAAGSQLTYTITVTNNSPTQATNVTVTDILAPGVAFVSGAGCVLPNGNTVTCSIGTIAGSGHSTLSLTVSTPGPPSITNVAGVVSDQFDLSPQDNWATASTTLTTARLLFYTLTPCRILDTRNTNGPLGGPILAPWQTRTFTVTGVCAIPSNARTVSANYTVPAPAGIGSLTVLPGGDAGSQATSISFRTGLTRANNGLMSLSWNGAGAIQVTNNSSSSTHVIIDANGYFK